MFQVVKRDGEVADFQMSKITAAIDKAFDAKEKIYSRDMVDLLGLRVTADFQSKIHDNKVTVEDIRNFGMIPEFIGRLPIIFTLQELTKDMMVEVLKEPKNAILKQYQRLLELDEVDLEFDEGAIEAIAEKALEKKTGARALRAVLEEYMLDIMYEIPKDDNIGKVTITRSYIEKTGGPLIEMRGCDAIPMHH